MKCNGCANRKSYVTGDDEYPARTALEYCLKGHWENECDRDTGEDNNSWDNCKDYQDQI